MFYAALKAVHLLSIVVWVGGLFFVIVCLRPALRGLDGPTKLRFASEVLGRFLTIVNMAVALVLGSGLAMLWLAVREAKSPGLSFNMPLDWYAMIGLGLVMMAIFGHLRGVLFKRLDRAVKAGDWAAGAAAFEPIPGWLVVNLVLGVIVIVAMRLGAAA